MDYKKIARDIMDPERDLLNQIAVPSHRAPGEYVDGEAVRDTIRDFLGNDPDWTPVQQDEFENIVDVVLVMVNVALVNYDMGYHWAQREVADRSDDPGPLELRGWS